MGQVLIFFQIKEFFVGEIFEKQGFKDSYGIKHGKL